MTAEEITALSDRDLLDAYQRHGAEAGEPIGDAIAAEIERRGLDI